MYESRTVETWPYRLAGLSTVRVSEAMTVERRGRAEEGGPSWLEMDGGVMTGVFRGASTPMDDDGLNGGWLVRRGRRRRCRVR